MTDEWREWRLVWYAVDLVRRPGDQPPDSAELSADGAWATGFVERDGATHVGAMWMRYRKPTSETLARASARLDARRSSG